MPKAKKISIKNDYFNFDQIDGSHPFKEVLPEGFVDYPARIRKGGKVKYFNFQLAKQMGLIPEDHVHELNESLSDKILETFSIQIINEFDEIKKRKFPKSEMKSGTYMATRYLQLQHENKQGKTSGDGRSVWNGQVKFKNKTWDISSGGTGATKLSPATSKFNKFFETGDPTISYGCGYAEIDEGFATAVMSSIYDANNLSTEKSLAIIEFKNNLAINIRAHENLIRPSHVFLYLKQDDLVSLKKIIDFYIERQRDNKDWKDCPKSEKKYDYLLSKLVSTFSKLAARFEDDYIFCWLDWDGDNILMDGGIIDYGSVRQFGMFHYEYRYDDVDRYSTNLIEQKSKAKYIVQSFIQAIDYIKTGTKKSIHDFNDHDSLTAFETEFEYYKNYNFLFKIGLSERKAKQYLKRNEEKVTEFRKVFNYFEKAKSKRGMVEISDGVTCDAIFNVRDLLREYPQILMIKSEISPKDFMSLMKSSFLSDDELEINSYRKQKIDEFQKYYSELVGDISKLFQEPLSKTLLNISKRSQIVNKADRITGDAATYIVELLLKNRNTLSAGELDDIITALRCDQITNPEEKKVFPSQFSRKIIFEIKSILQECREGI